MSLTATARRIDPEDREDVENALRRYRGFAYGVLWAGFLALMAWGTVSALQGRPDWGHAFLWMLPLTWGLVHRFVAVPLAARTLRRRVRLRKRSRRRRRRGQGRRRSYRRRAAGQWLRAIRPGRP